MKVMNEGEDKNDSQLSRLPRSLTPNGGHHLKVQGSSSRSLTARRRISITTNYITYLVKSYHHFLELFSDSHKCIF